MQEPPLFASPNVNEPLFANQPFAAYLSTPDTNQHAAAFYEAHDILRHRYDLSEGVPLQEAARLTNNVVFNLEQWRKSLQDLDHIERSGNPFMFQNQTLRALARRRIQDELARMTRLREKHSLREAKREAVLESLASIRKRKQTRETAELLDRLNKLPKELRRKVLNELSGAKTTFPAI